MLSLFVNRANFMSDNVHECVDWEREICAINLPNIHAPYDSTRKFRYKSPLKEKNAGK